ncbi:hypothetical protein BH721_07480 [Clostridium baratii]|uniref:hypothetical protein n=1 Tax=Clostridium baratii TaxID=1561 RepID=UPI0009A346B5|nr:hypothetical protein [Clostridium baratii]OPF50687.1 hypothetical protein A1M12_07580 [Clostridium baratii]OPF54069.1 hypothetical protein BH721_07480 [Clostridium baratii]OPF58633.1 hypothetical protein BH724_00385 [Clostridium baratii]OPF58995.1 hypothetical protein BH725_10255 [Clostridium baratii]
MGKKGVKKHNDFTYLRGRGIKYAVLVDKNEKLKIIPYNFDYVTFLFGGISYLVRKHILKGISLILAQAIFIYTFKIPVGLVLNYIITFILALFSGKDYVGNLINKGAIEFNNYEENGCSLEYNQDKEITELQEKNIKIKKRKIVENIKIQNLIFYITSIAIISIGTIVTGINLKSDLESKNRGVYANKEDDDIFNFTMLLTDEENLHSFSIVEVNKLENSIKASYYVGELLIKDDEKTLSANEVYKKDGIIKDSIIKENFDIDNGMQLKLNLKDYKKFMDYNKKYTLDKIYNNILLKSTELEYKKFNEFVNSISLLEKNEDKNLVNEKYLDLNLVEGYKKIIDKDTFKLTKGEYKEKRLSEIVSVKAISALNGELKDKVIYYIDEKVLDLNDTIKKLKDKDEEIKAKEVEEIDEDNDTSINNDGGQVGSQSNESGASQGSSSSDSQGSGSGGSQGGGSSGSQGSGSSGSQGSGSSGSQGSGSSGSQGSGSSGSQGSGSGDSQNGSSGGSQDSGSGDSQDGGSDGSQDGSSGGSPGGSSGESQGGEASGEESHSN